MHELLVFRYPFSIQNTSYRILLVKVKNSFSIEFHLGDHKYYDKVRTDLNLAGRSRQEEHDKHDGKQESL